jgi:hypothetical protein
VSKGAPAKIVSPVGEDDEFARAREAVDAHLADKVL